MKKIRFCSKCVYADGLGLKNPENGNPIKIKKFPKGWLCQSCKDLESTGIITKDKFVKEINDYLDNKKTILFAYSGGLDSTAVLFILKNECDRRNIKLITFTINHGCKGEQALENVNRVINFLGVHHFWSDISSKLIKPDGPTVLENYYQCHNEKILACGKTCNEVMDKEYQKIMSKLNCTELFTGGDTPKKNEFGEYSIFWKKKSGITIVRGAYAFGLNKEMNDLIVKENNIPWIRPDCGGYDTDCLLPGAFFREALNGSDEISLEKLAEIFPIIFDYLAERVRFGTINRVDAIKMLERVDIGSQRSYEEIKQIFKTFNHESSNSASFRNTVSVSN